MAVRWCEPWPPAERTWSTPSASRSATTRTKWTLPSGRRGNGSAATAGTSGRSRLGVPGHPAQGGAGQQLEAHHRRHRVAGQAEHRRAVDQPEGEGLGRPDGDLHPAHVADAVEHDLHEVDVAHRHAAAGEHRVAASRRPRWMAVGDGGLVVADQAEVDGLPALLRDEREERGAVRVADLPGRERLAGLDQLVAGATARRRAAGGARAPRRRRCPASTPRWPAPITSPGSNTGSPARRSSPAARTASPAGTSASMATRAPSSRRRVCSTITTASAPSGIGAPVKIRIASPGASARSAGWPAATSATTGSSTGDAGDGAGRRRRPARRSRPSRCWRTAARPRATSPSPPARTPPPPPSTSAAARAAPPARARAPARRRAGSAARLSRCPARGRSR